MIATASSKTPMERRLHLFRKTVFPSARIFRFLFAGAYFSFILSSTALVRQDDTSSLLVFLLRSGALIGILAFWLMSIAHSSRASRVTIGFAGLFWPYLFSDAYLAYFDVLVLLVLGSNFRKSSTTEKYYIWLAYLSLGLVLLIALLAWFAIIPTRAFAWEGRVKEAMGFANPNTFYFFLTSSAVIFFLFKRPLSFFLTGVVIIGLFPLVGSWTFLITYILMAMFWVWPSILHYRLIIALLWAWLTATILLGLFTVWFPVNTTLFLNVAIGADVNELTSNRFGLLINAGEKNVFQLLLGGVENRFDSLYAYFLNSFGIVGMVAVLYIVLASVRRQVRAGSPIALAFTAIFFTTGLAEVPFDGSALISLVFFSTVLFGSAPRLEKSFKVQILRNWPHHENPDPLQ